MKHILSRHTDIGLLLVRLAIAGSFIAHGLQKFPLISMTTAPQMMPMPLFLLMKFLAIAEPVAGIALIVGILVRTASLCLSIIMIGAIGLKIFLFQIGYAAPGGYELDCLLLASSILLMLHGPGKIAIERFVARNAKNA